MFGVSMDEGVLLVLLAVVVVGPRRVPAMLGHIRTRIRQARLIWSNLRERAAADPSVAWVRQELGDLDPRHLLDEDGTRGAGDAFSPVPPPRLVPGTVAVPPESAERGDDPFVESDVPAPADAPGGDAPGGDAAGEQGSLGIGAVPAAHELSVRRSISPDENAAA